MASAALCTPVNARVSYARHLWWLMHHSYRPDLATMALTAYYDDSGTDDASPVTVLAGPVMSHEAFVEFEGKWSQLLDSYSILHPLHMKDFGGGVKHAGLSFGAKHEMFGKAADLINGHKLFSTSIGIPQPEFNYVLPKTVRGKRFGPYVLAFLCAVLANKSLCDQSILYGGRTISYLVDDGSSGKGQLKDAHSEIIEIEKSRGGIRNTGSMAFDVDDRVSALQAADVIAWAARRRAVLGPLTGAFAPLEKVLSETQEERHLHIDIPVEGIQQFTKPIINWLRSNGEMPLLRDIIVS